ncbi:MAG: transcriptional repressor [Candidatus Thermoplasmatota archaeon]|jgi:Fur family ferric uptake transcriptional regulator|nr:transcriptional repressor [Candidatus Thermoplasmatota archaeon]
MAQVRQTKQRSIIEEEVRKFKTFFTAEEVHEKVRERDPRIGTATVYRYLKDVEGEDKPHYYYCDRKKIYSFKSDNHCHFYCTVCGKTSHFHIEKIDFLKNSIKGGICHFQIDVYGVCDDCQGK